MKKIISFIMIAALIAACIPSTAEAASKVKLNKKKATLTITDEKANPAVTLNVKGVSKKIAKKAKWSTSNKKVATVKKGRVTAKKAGKAVITCKVKGKKLACKITVTDKRMDSEGLEVELKDLGPINRKESLALIDRMQSLYEQEMPQEFWDNLLYNSGGAYTERQIEQFKQFEKMFLSSRWVINTQIVTTYNGQDVSNRADYMIEYNDGTLDPNPVLKNGKWVLNKATRKPVIKDGIMDIHSAITLTDTAKASLIVTYNGKKKIVPVKISTEMDELTICYCGQLNDEEHVKEKSYKMAHGIDDREVHAGYWYGEYGILTIEPR